MITRINKLRTLTKHISCKFECKFDSKKCNFSRCECKNMKEHCVCKKGYFWNPATCICENCKYVGSIIGDSVVILDEIIAETKTIPTKSTSTKAVLTKGTSASFYISLAFLLITIALVELLD